MEEVILAALFGAFLSHLLVPFVLSVMKNPLFLKKNYRGKEVCSGGGLIILFSGLIITLLLDLFHLSPGCASEVVFFLSSIGLVGFIDDVYGSGEARGFCGHFRRLFARGELTTGLLKVILIGLMSLLFAASFAKNPYLVIMDGVLISLSANTLNLLDLRPGRAGKFFLLAVIPLVLGFHISELWVWAFFGSAVGYLKWDLGEEVMLGDMGANMLGALAGAILVLFSPFGVKVLIILVLLFLNLLSERLSLGSVIEQRPLLAWFDNLGRK